MTEEEKKAIKNLQEVAEKGIDIYEEINVMENEDAIRIVLNLIEKQQNLIEKLKKDREILYGVIDELKEDIENEKRCVEEMGE